MDFISISRVLSGNPRLLGLSLEAVTKFTRLCSISRPYLEVHALDDRLPPNRLPADLTLVLSKCMGLEEPDINALWAALKDDIWSRCSQIKATEDEILLYNQHALPFKMSYRQLIPPVRVCQFYDCENYRTSNHVRTLTDARVHDGTLFTLHEGALPIFTTSLYCRKCSRRYYVNCSVDKSRNVREYYRVMPDVVQVAKHYFMDAPLLELFAVAKVFGWMSALNCARMHAHALSYLHAQVLNNPKAYPPSILHHHIARSSSITWKYSFQLDSEHALNGFFLYSLLLEHAERNTSLVIEHDVPSQRDRLKPALEMRNSAIEGIGQESYTHACSRCFLVSTDENGNKVKIHPAVCDGVTIGHPCCAIQDCHAALLNNHHRFCENHINFNDQCAIQHCASTKEEGFQTCTLPEHRALEESYFEKGKAFFQLSAKLKKLAVPPDSIPLPDASQADDKISADVIDEAPDIPPEGDDKELPDECSGKPETGNQKMRSYFGRRRTYNEQFILRPCGVILSRATLFGSEAISAVNEFAKATFPTPESTPEFFVFDNNCKLRSHQITQKDYHFENTGMPVDVFHFKSKHKESDKDCQTYCNPAAFPEIIDKGKWKINTSICEQTNRWLGGYQAILRDMECTRFNFYLDEMVKRRNRYVIKEQERKGYCPWNIPIEALIP